MAEHECDGDTRKRCVHLGCETWMCWSCARIDSRPDAKSGTFLCKSHYEEVKLQMSFASQIVGQYCRGPWNG